jgi:hypothetical protein
METRLYGGISSAQIVVPEREALDQVQSYIAMAIAGRATDAQRRTSFPIGERLHRPIADESIGQPSRRMRSITPTPTP